MVTTNPVFRQGSPMDVEYYFITIWFSQENTALSQAVDQQSIPCKERMVTWLLLVVLGPTNIAETLFLTHLY